MKTLLEGGAHTENMGGFEFRRTTPLQMAVGMNQDGGNAPQARG